MARALISSILLLFSMSAWPIANGQLVSDSDFADYFPWTVALVHKVSGELCGGVIIAPRWVVTAAHCAKQNRYVLLGNADRTKGLRVEVERAVRHPEFDKDTLQYDVGLLLLAEPVDINPASMVSAAESRLLLVPGAPATIVGWGKIGTAKEASRGLAEGPARLDGLIKRGSQYIYDDPYTGPCGFDSGGPMIMVTVDGQRVVTGVASATDGNLCAKGGGIAVYTNLATVRAFIDTQLARFPTE